MIRVAFVHNRFPSGGAERITIDIARYLKGIGQYEVYVYATKIDHELMPGDSDDILSLRHIPSQAIQARRSAAVEKLITDDHIDILVQVTKSLKGIGGIRRRTGCKTVVACHGEPFWQRYAIIHRRQKGLIRKIMWVLFNRKRYEDGTLAMRKAVERTRKEYLDNDAYTVLCKSYKCEVADVLGIDADESHIYAIENPERIQENISLDKEKIILFCGRFENWSKRIDRLLRIWSKIQHSLPDWRLVLVGDGPAGKMLRQMADDMNLERISFEGMKSDVAPYYRKASVVAMTSETEGWPLALTEAQAHGCIGVAFGCTSGVKEILSPDGECGFIVPPYDEDMFAETLLKIASMTDAEQMRIRRNGLEKRRQYVPEMIAEKWKSLFDGLAGN